MISTHPKVGMAVLVGGGVKAHVWALARHYAPLRRVGHFGVTL